MSYEIIQTGETEVFKLLHVTSTRFRKWIVWRVQFHDGKETFLYRCDNEWMQWSKTHLDKPVLKAVADCIENTSIRNQLKSIFA
ncbi:hypothetical protein BDD43_4983 [Mucilaginibacter gracilis]|uniref:Uncharacterized protein n=1 Tax=Mucilaginibacter gracilis TaxID=423350 RepID=A0A495J879_9SPHI|nr:hypothetical protein [Mucilaginibacter gracilis]RKR84732.1 hypothetical protein BDD43_4983 [Mucilaginibacter gracilis]